MTCKDCIHYEVCSQFSKADGANHEYYTYTNLSEKCECFKCKREFVRLPFPVGTVLYRVTSPYRREPKITEEKIKKLRQINNKTE